MKPKTKPASRLDHLIARALKVHREIAKEVQKESGRKPRKAA